MSSHIQVQVTQHTVAEPVVGQRPQGKVAPGAATVAFYSRKMV